LNNLDRRRPWICDSLDRRRLRTCILGGASVDVSLGALLQHSNKLDGRLFRDSFFNFRKLAVEDLRLREDVAVVPDVTDAPFAS